MLTLRKPAWTRKSQTWLVLILMRSRCRAPRAGGASRILAHECPLDDDEVRAPYGLGRMRSSEQSTCSSGVRRCSAGLCGAAVGMKSMVVDSGQGREEDLRRWARARHTPAGQDPIFHSQPPVPHDHARAIDPDDRELSEYMRAHLGASSARVVVVNTTT